MLAHSSQLKFLPFDLFKADHNLTAAVTKLERVAHQVDKHLPKPAFIAVKAVKVLLILNEHWLHLQRNLLVLGNVGHLAKHIIDSLH